MGLISQDLCEIVFGGGSNNQFVIRQTLDSEFAGGVELLVHNEDNIIN